jgi:hypothetical protein
MVCELGGYGCYLNEVALWIGFRIPWKMGGENYPRRKMIKALR